MSHCSEPERRQATRCAAGDERCEEEREPEYLTAAQVGNMLQISPKSVYRLAAKDPTFPQLRLMGSIRFPRERLARWLKSREGSQYIR